MSQVEVPQNIEKSTVNFSYAVNQKRPGVRFFARYIDIFIFSIFLIVVWHNIFNFPLPKSDIGLYLIILFLWIFVEAVFLSFVGTTFGKWLLKVNLTHNDRTKKIAFPDALQRSFLVWLKGLGIGFPYIIIVTLIFAYSDLTKKGFTSWDKEGSFTVTHEKIGYIRAFIGVLLFIIFLVFLFFGKS